MKNIAPVEVDIVVENIMSDLSSLGTAQTIKTMRKHGVKGEMFGVKYGDLNKLAKKYKGQHAAALALWQTGNHDARILMTMIADPKKIDAATLDAWTNDFDGHVIAEAVGGFAGKTPHVREKAEQWISSPNEWIATAGWGLVSVLAVNDKTLPDSYFEKHLQTIEQTIHNSANRVRYAMNNTIINIGLRNAALEEQAVAVAQRIGVVEVDHGDTDCETPDACAYIAKTKAYREKKAAKN
jgi:3-methyladenine DNA glycosylase AlkD